MEEIIAILDLISVLFFGGALVFLSRTPPRVLDRTPKMLLSMCMTIYIFVGLSNILEHGQITDFFDGYEDYLEIIFLPLFLFFIYSTGTNEELKKRRSAEEELKNTLDKLESLVEDRTSDLKETNDRLREEIVEKEKAKVRSRESEERYRDLFENASDLIQIVGDDAKFKYVNKKWLEILEYNSEEIEELTVKDIIHQDHLQECMVIFGELINGNNLEKIETIFKTKNGREVYVEGNISSHFEDGKFINTRGIFRDVTERKKAEEALKESQRVLLESQKVSNTGSYILDIPLGKWQSSKVLDDIFGIDKDYVRSVEGWESIIHPEWQKMMVDYFMVEVVEKRGLFNKEYKIIRQNDRAERWVLGLGKLEFDMENNPSKMIGTIQDITERKKAEDSLKKYAGELEEANQFKDLFADIMRHDLLNPIGIIKTSSELLLEEYPEIEDLPIIYQNSRKAIEIVEDASMLSMLESTLKLKKRDLDLKNIIDNVLLDLRPIFKTADMEVINNITESFKIRANKMIEHVFINLLTNAVKYAPEGKKIIIDGEENGKMVKIKFKDFGKGIPDSQKDTIFTRYKRIFKGSAKGTGLGLAIVKRLVELHDGRVWVEDNPEAGAVFAIELPKGEHDLG